MFSFVTVLSAVLFVGIATHAAAEESADALVIRYYNVNLSTATAQERVCVKPLVNTTERCHADFSDLYDKVSQSMGAQLMYRRARLLNDSRAMQFYWNAFQRSRSAMLAAEKQVKEQYLSPETTSQAPSKSPTLAGDGKPVGKRPAIKTQPRLERAKARQ